MNVHVPRERVDVEGVEITRWLKRPGALEWRPWPTAWGRFIQNEKPGNRPGDRYIISGAETRTTERKPISLSVH